MGQKQNPNFMDMLGGEIYLISAFSESECIPQ